MFLAAVGRYFELKSSDQTKLAASKWHIQQWMCQTTEEAQMCIHSWLKNSVNDLLTLNEARWIRIMWLEELGTLFDKT